jgi:hypothetical protein
MFKDNALPPLCNFPHGRPWILRDLEDGEWYCAIYKGVRPLCGMNELLDRALAGAFEVRPTEDLWYRRPPSTTLPLCCSKRTGNIPSDGETGPTRQDYPEAGT